MAGLQDGEEYPSKWFAKSPNMWRAVIPIGLLVFLAVMQESTQLRQVTPQHDRTLQSQMPSVVPVVRDPDDVEEMVEEMMDMEAHLPENVLWQRFGGKYGDMLEALLNTTTRYYVYDDDAIDQPKSHVDNTTEVDYLNLAPDAETDMLIINSLKNHPLRTYNPEEATYFFIPFSDVAIQAAGLPEYNITLKAVEALTNKKWFQRNYGNDHILVATWWGRFEHRMFKLGRLDPLNRFYAKLWNVTQVHGKCRRGIEQLYQENQHPDFQSWFKIERLQMNRATFSLGNLPVPWLPVQEPSYERFMNAKYFMFYHVRPTKFWTPHSTEFRNKPLQPDVIASLPNSSMGYDLPKDEWWDHFTSSKFCLVLRGDDPNSHALLRSLKVGCIPVVVSDAFPLYAPTLPSSIDMYDYAIFIPEQQFWDDPKGSLLKLTELSEEFIKDKLLSLAWAQHVLIPDHPESLFVPAFLRETFVAQELRRPEKTLIKYNRKHPMRGRPFYMK